MSKPKIDVYTMDHCPYCDRAKALLKERGIPYGEHRVPLDDDAAWEELYQRSRMRTLPQIYVDGKVLGGYTDLAALDAKDQLKHLKG